MKKPAKGRLKLKKYEKQRVNRAYRRKYTIVGIYKDNDDQVFGDSQMATAALEAAKQSVIENEEGDLFVVDVMRVKSGQTIEAGLLEEADYPMSREDLGVHSCEDCGHMFDASKTKSEEVCDECWQEREEEAKNEAE